MATIIKRPYTTPIDFRKDAEDDIVTAFYKNNEVKLIYKGDKKIFESQRLYTTFTADKAANANYGNTLYIDNMNSTYGHITEIYIDGVLQKETTMSLEITKPTSIKIKGQFTLQDSKCDMYDFFMADGLMWVVNGANAMFKNCTGIKNLDLTYFNTSTVGKNMQNLFSGCTALQTVNINNFDVINITNISSLFSGCSLLKKVDMSGWKNATNIQWAESVFKNCTSLESVILPQFSSYSQNSSLERIRGMFNGCTNLKYIDMSGIDSNSLIQGWYGTALSDVPLTCKVCVNSNFTISPADLGWVDKDGNIGKFTRV